MEIRKFSHAKKITFLISAFFINSTFADVKTMADLDQIQADTMYYRALAQKNKAVQESGEGNVVAQSTTLATSGASVNQANKLPVVESIMGNSRGLLARLRNPDNTLSSVKVGDVIYGGLKISKISISSVQAISLANGSVVELREGAQ